MNTNGSVESMLDIKSNMIDTCIAMFVTNGNPFTSIDISNTLKKNGFWVSNSDVASYLAKMREEKVFENNGNAFQYICTVIDGIHIYHSINDNPLGANIRQEAIRPNEFNDNMNPIKSNCSKPVEQDKPEEMFNVAFSVSQGDNDILFYRKKLTRRELEKLIRTFKVI